MPPRLVPESTNTRGWRSAPLMLFVASLPLTGCDSLQKKHDNPVMVTAPRRVEPEETNDAEEDQYAEKDGADKFQKEDEGENFQLVRAALTKNPWDDWKDDTTIFNSQVAATVNGVPVLNGDILDRFAGYLISVREEMAKVARDPKSKGQIPTPDDFAKLRYAIIQREISGYIQKKLLVERLKSGMKPEQLKLMEAHIDELFEKEVTRLKQELKVNNKTELEMSLNKKGTTLKNVRDNFALGRLAEECIHIKSDKPKNIERADLIAFYQSHPEGFNVTAKVKWEQIQISFSPSVDKKAAIKKLEQAIAEVESGIPFETVARKYSDGPTAKDGGSWDWMEEGNLKDTKLEKKLFEMPTDVLSEIHEGPESVSVVRVNERQDAGRKPFKEVQQEIHDLIQLQQRKDSWTRAMKKLFSNAVIESQYSLPSFGGDE